MLRRTLLLSAASAALWSCASAPASESAAGPDSGPDSGPHAFDVALYRALAAQAGNQFVSTYSVSSAFALLYPGARGQTASEMSAVFGFDADASAATSATRAIADNLAANTGGSELALANAAWVERTMGLEPAFAQSIREGLNGTIEPVDFIADQPAALAQINAWAARNTRDRITQILTTPDESRRLVLTNAVYFKGAWRARFSASSTRDGQFHARGGPVPARLMRQVARHRYFETDDFQAAELEYDSGAFALAVFLPRAQQGIAAFERGLSGARLGEWLARLGGAETARLDLTLPKLELRTDYDLVPQLQAMGLNRAFNGADFSGVTRQADLVVGAVIHKTFLAIDEEGTEAAAVTAIDMVLTSAMPRPEPEPIEFKADRPFFLALHHKPSRALLFLGRIETVAPA